MKNNNTSFKTNRLEKKRMFKRFFESTKIGEELYKLGYIFDDVGCDDIRASNCGYFKISKI